LRDDLKRTQGEYVEHEKEHAKLESDIKNLQAEIDKKSKACCNIF